MSTCSRCGNSVEFRYVNGRCIPLHLYGGCTGEGNSRINDCSGYNTSYESTCFSTNCPECGDEVFFIRYNGGSVWIDPPLGPPWYKHACFDNGQETRSRASLASEYEIGNLDCGEDANLVIGVVKSTYVDYQKAHTETVLETAKSENVELKVKNNAGFLLGRLCLYNKKEKVVWPAEEPGYVFEVRTHKPFSSSLVSCPECNAKVNPKNLKKHLRRQHGHS